MTGVMVKLYASLFGSIHAVGGTLRGRIEMAMSKLIPQKSQRVQNWLEKFCFWYEAICTKAW